MLLERCPVAEVVIEPDAGVVYEQVQPVDQLDGRLDLGPIGDVEGEGDDPLVGVDYGLAGAGVDASGAAPEADLHTGGSRTAENPQRRKSAA